MSVDTASHLYVAHSHCMQHAEKPPLPQPVPCAHILAHRILKIEGNNWYEVGLPNLSTIVFCPYLKFSPTGSASNVISGPVCMSLGPTAQLPFSPECWFASGTLLHFTKSFGGTLVFALGGWAVVCQHTLKCASALGVVHRTKCKNRFFKLLQKHLNHMSYPNQ